MLKTPHLHSLLWSNLALIHCKIWPCVPNHFSIKCSHKLLTHKTTCGLVANNTLAYLQNIFLNSKKPFKFRYLKTGGGFYFPRGYLKTQMGIKKTSFWELLGTKKVSSWELLGTKKVSFWEQLGTIGSVGSSLKSLLVRTGPSPFSEKGEKWEPPNTGFDINLQNWSWNVGFYFTNHKTLNPKPY